jgi:hypothetical protein
MNRVTSLDVSKNPLLRDLICAENQLRVLDVSKNSALYWLSCFSNQLTALDVSGKTALYYLDCRYNYIRSADEILGWQALGLVFGESFIYYPQFSGEEFSGSVLYQDSYIKAMVTLTDSVGNSKYIPTEYDGTYSFITPTGSGYTLTVTKAGYLSYTLTNLTLTKGQALPTIDITQLAGDVNGDGVVNAVDLTYMLSEFNRGPLNHIDTDINGDDTVNATDLTYLLAGFNKKDVLL